MRLLHVLIAIFVSQLLYSQWKQIQLPSNTPDFDILENGDFYFTYQEHIGVFRSPDQGLNWTTIMKGLPTTLELRDFTIVNNILFVATSGEGVYRSSDNGDNWELVGSGLPIRGYHNFTVDEDRIYTVDVNENIHVTNDYGDTWVEINGPFENNNLVSKKTVISNGNGILFAIGDGSLFKTEDDGITWTTIDVGRVLSTIRDFLVDSNSIWISISDENGEWILLISRDSGSTWNVIDLDNFGAATIAKNDQYVCYTSGSGTIFFSSDIGETWNNTSSLGYNRLIKSDVDGFLLSGNDNLAFFNPSDLSFEEKETTGINDYNFSGIEDGTDDLVIYSSLSPQLTVAFLSKSDNLFTDANTPVGKNAQGIGIVDHQLHALLNNDIYSYDATEQTWNLSFPHPTNEFIVSLVSGGERLFATSTIENELLISSEDNAFDQTTITPGFIGSIRSAIESDTLLIVNAQNEMLFSIDDGVTWTVKDPDSFSAPYTTIVAEGKIFAATINGFYVSDDTGNSWSEIENDLFEDLTYLTYHDKRIYLGQKTGLFVSPDLGLHWFHKSDPDQYIFPIKDLLIDGTKLYTNTIGGGIWEIPIEDLYDDPVITGMSQTLVFSEGHQIKLELEDLQVTDSDNTYPDDFSLILLDGEGYSINSDGTIIPESEQETEITVNVQVSDGFAESNVFEASVTVNKPLSANELSEDRFLYPNPANTLLRIPIQSGGSYSIEILNTTGQLLKKVARKPQDSILDINVSDLPPGLYFLRLISDTQTTNHKFIKN